MNFFEAQDRARRNTTWLVILFIVAVAGLVLLSNLLLLAAMSYGETKQVDISLTTMQHVYSWDVFLAVTIGICLLILCGSLYKVASLSGGGASVAEMLGGKLVPRNTNDYLQKRLLNVVEEMAIAAGTPIPKVYLLEETSINAFAAGSTPADAVIGVTRGTLMRLSREELQGVVAHEFSHIFNGDMRLNIRLIGILHGILLIGLIGSIMMRSIYFTGGSRNNKNGNAAMAIAAIGVGLIVIGYVGTFFGSWIKAAVSRQREYLADSSAVQFTRNTDSIAGALKKIGGGDVGSLVDAPEASEYSHAFFANGIGSFWQSMFSTHPPLEKRIRAIDPRWDGKFLASSLEQPRKQQEPSKAATSKLDTMAVTAAILSSAEQAISKVGTLNEKNIEYVHQLIVEMPPKLREASQSAFSSRAVVYAILISKQDDKQQAWDAMQKHADPSMPKLVNEYLIETKGLEDKFLLPLLEISINSLKELSQKQYIRFKEAIHQIIIADEKIDLNEWIIQRLVIQQLDIYFGFRKAAKLKYAKLDKVKSEIISVLSLIAHIEHKDSKGASIAFNSGAKVIGIEAMEILPREMMKLSSLDESLDQLMQLKPLLKPGFLKACIAIIYEDEEATIRGIEIVRTISTCLDCPMPPMMK